MNIVWGGEGGLGYGYENVMGDMRGLGILGGGILGFGCGGVFNGWYELRYCTVADER